MQLFFLIRVQGGGLVLGKIKPYLIICYHHGNRGNKPAMRENRHCG